MNSKALYGAVLFGAVASLFVACGDGDSTKIVICNNKQVTCLNAEGGEVCSADGTLKLPFSCGQGETCCVPGKNKTCTDYMSNGAAGGGGEASADLTQAGCVSSCSPGKTECATSKVSRVCSEDGRAWIPVACPAGTGCDDATGTCKRSDDPEDTVTVCTQGQRTCADTGAVKECEEDGSNWIYKICPTGTSCEMGTCAVNPTLDCAPNSGVCADKKTARICKEDGSGYDEVDCEDMDCIDGACRGPVCTKGEVRCDDVRDGNVFAQFVSGQYDTSRVYTCNADGTAWVISQCDPGFICAYDNIAATTINAYIEDVKAAYRSGEQVPIFDVPETSRAQCFEPGCAAPFALRELFGSSFQSYTGGSFVCGEPDGSNPLDSFTLCEGLPPYNNLHWANYACPDDTQCRYDGAPSQSEGESGPVIGPVCSQTCRPGTQACFQAYPGSPGIIATTGESTITCGDDGEWDYSTVQHCTVTSLVREQWCGPNLQGTVDNYNIGTCMDPACAYWFDAYDTFALPEGVGACGTDGNFYQCQPDGTFADPSDDCASCTLEPRASGSGLPATYAGYDPGTCQTCVENQRSCLINFDPISLTGSPFFRECDANGNVTVESCDGGELCHDFVELDQSLATYGLGNVICGGECVPNSAECGGTFGQQRRECSTRGAWGVFENCSRGACTQDDTSGFGLATCEQECIPGTFTCPGGQAVPCTTRGRYDYEAAADCDTGEVCVDKQGCGECDNGQFSGRPATRCDPDDAGLIQACQPNGTWGGGVACPGDDPACTGTNPAAYCLPDQGGGSAGTAGTGGTAGAGGTAGTAGNGGTAGDIGIAGTAGLGLGGDTG